MKGTLFRKIGVGIVCLSMLVSSLPAQCHVRAKGQTALENKEVCTGNKKNAAAEKTGSIVLDGDDIRTDNVNGLTYKGFGLLSANSTSDLLMDYKAQNPEAYAGLLQYLFGGEHPIMTHVKLEMGNDRNNSTGTEASTKRSRYEMTNILRNLF